MQLPDSITASFAFVIFQLSITDTQTYMESFMQETESY